MNRSITVPAEYYWAIEDAQELAAILTSKREDYLQFLLGSNLGDRILRLWRYYHNFYDQGIASGARSQGGPEIVFEGEDGEMINLSVNHLRSIIHMLLTYITQNPPYWEAMASNADHRSIEDARLVRSIMEDYVYKFRLGGRFRRAVEHSLILTEGFMTAMWDEESGPETGEFSPVYDERGQISGGGIGRIGDFAFGSPTIFDVCRDYTQREWESHDWVLIDVERNKWDLVAQYPELQEQILSGDSYGLQSNPTRSLFLSNSSMSDSTRLRHFFHRPTAAMPFGRHMAFVNPESVLVDENWGRQLPIKRMVPAELLLTAFGHTPGFDLLGPQELVNAEFSTIATSHNALGQTKIWFKTGSPINQADLEPGITVIQSDDKPEPLNLLSTPAEIYETIKVAVQHMEYVSGVNSVARGQPEASLKSGTALAMIDQKAIQFSAPLQAAYTEFVEDIGNLILEGLKEHALSPRVVAMAGIRNRVRLKEFSAKDLQGIQRVRVKSASPFMSTVAGRVQFGEMLVQSGLIKNSQELLTLVETGRMEPLLASSESQLSIIHEENDAMLEGRLVEPLSIDDGRLHILEHTALLDSIEVRNNKLLLAVILGHIEGHVELLSDPQTQSLQVLLGYIQPAMPGQDAEVPPGQSGSQEKGPKPSKAEQEARQIEGQAPEGMPPEAVASMQGAKQESMGG